MPDAAPQSTPVPTHSEAIEEEPVDEESTIDEIDEPKMVPEIVTSTRYAILYPDIESRIWPWPKGEAWDARQVHREVVSALELVKSGKRG